jgi:hypothetical protein
MEPVYGARRFAHRLQELHFVQAVSPPGVSPNRANDVGSGDTPPILTCRIEWL